MDKLHVINNSLSNIREILGEDCTHIQELPNIVQFLKDDATKNGHTTSFIFSTQSSPNQPSGSSLDTTTGLVTDLESGWYQTNNIESKSQNQVWMSFAIFDSLGNRTTEWATPINIKGARGERGLPGEKGEVGETGPKGDKGDSKSFRTVSVYTTTNTLNSPSKPVGGKWDILTNEVILNDDNWYLNSDQVSKGTYLWMSQATFAEDGRLLNNWCSPFRLTGENGKNGVDGVRSEFIYRLLPDITSYENLREFTKNLYSPEYEDNYVPVANDNLNIGTVWSNHPSGISEGFPIEVCCNRTRKSSEESWSGWSSCIIWAKWGEDGIDGDGVEYIYRITPKKIDDQDITSKYVEDYFMPNLYEAVDFEGYQEDGYYFADYGWTAEPTDVSPANPVEWVSIRKKINGVWDRFTSPKVWATFSEDGAAYITSFVFKRGSDVNDVLTGGSFEKPRPDQYDWSDSIPTDSDLPVWMSCRTFKSNDNTYGSWTSPKMLSDTPDFQVEYTAKIERPNPNLYPFDGNINKWRAEQSKAGYEWGDDSQISDPKWMATTSRKNGKWSEWILTMIKGEKGEKGDAGSSVAIEGHFDSESELFIAWSNYVNYGDISGFYFESKDGIINQGDGWYTKDSGLLYTYSGGWDGDIENSKFDDYWFSTPIKGEPGNSTHLYIKYTDTNVEGVTLYDTPKKYIGIKLSDVELDPKTLNTYSTYTWSKFRGDDGFSQEQVFLLTDTTYDPSVGNNPPIPTDNKSVAGYLPLHGLGENAKGTDDGRWTDSPLSVSKDFPYCWVVSRRATDSEYGNWVGDYNGAALYSRYSADGINGKGALSINLTNDVVVVPMDGDYIDSDFIDENGYPINPITTDVQLFLGDDPFEDFTIDSCEFFTVDDHKLSLTNSGLLQDSIIVTANYSGGSISTSWKVNKTRVAYELIPNHNVIRRFVSGEKSGKLEQSELTVTIKKWDGTAWIPANKRCGLVINDSSVEEDAVGGQVEFNLSSYKNVTSLRVYLVEDESIYEDIAIIADGTNGVDGNSIINITKKYAVNNDAKNPPKEGWVEDSTTLSTNYDTARYMWCWERTEYSQSDPTDSYYIVTIHGEPGNNTGTKAPMIYPAGVWIPGKVYSSTVDKVPYVYYLDVDADGNPTDSTGYYVLGEELGDYQSNVTPNNDPNWNKMESFEAIYSDIGLFNQALVGKWVFHGDYMFSQVGTLDGVESNNYGEFYINNWLPEDDPNYDNDTSSRFIPNVVFNAKTGESWHVGGSIRFGKDQNSSSINLQKTTIDRTYGRPRGIYETTSISNSGIGYLRAVKDGNMSAYNDTEIGINLDGFTAKGFNASGHYIKTNINNNGLTISSYDGESEVENLKISDNSFSIGEISIENNNILKSKNEANEVTFGNGKVELSDNYDTTVRISCENDGEDIPSYINIGNFNPQPARSGGHYDDLKSYISTGTTDATETFTAIKTHDGYYAGFKPTFEIKTLDSNNTSVFLTNLSQIYKIDVAKDGTYEVFVHDYLSKSDAIPEGMFHEIYLNVSSGLDAEVKFKQPFINDVLYSVKTNSKYKSLIRCHYCFGEWHFFEIKSA